MPRMCLDGIATACQLKRKSRKSWAEKGKFRRRNFEGFATVPYMSPEQLRGLPVDMRSDIYAAGAVLYEMATGRRPFPQTQTAELMTAILVQTLPPARSVNPVVSPKMESVIAKSLEKDPTQRFQSARDLRAALQGVAALSSTVSFQPDPQLMASSESAVPESAPAESSPPWKAIVGGAALACLIVAGLLFGLNVHGMRDRVLRRHRPVAEPPATPSLAIENPPAKPTPVQPAAAPQPVPPVTAPAQPALARGVNACTSLCATRGC